LFDIIPQKRNAIKVDKEANKPIKEKERKRKGKMRKTEIYYSSYCRRKNVEFV